MQERIQHEVSLSEAGKNSHTYSKTLETSL